MEKSRFAAILAVLSLSVGLTVIGSGTVNAAAGDRHFIQIATHGAPLWRAKAKLYNGRGELVYSWAQQTKSGGKVLWEFTDGGDKGWLYVHIDGGLADTITKEKLSLDRDHCFLVDPTGTPRYTGDSVNGGCNSR